MRATPSTRTRATSRSCAATPTSPPNWIPSGTTRRPGVDGALPARLAQEAYARWRRHIGRTARLAQEAARLGEHCAIGAGETRPCAIGPQAFSDDPPTIRARPRRRPPRTARPAPGARPARFAETSPSSCNRRCASIRRSSKARNRRARVSACAGSMPSATSTSRPISRLLPNNSRQARAPSRSAAGRGGGRARANTTASG